MLRDITTKEIWDHTKPINGVRHPKDIETKWTAEELAALNLEVVQAPAEKQEPVARTQGTFLEFMELFTLPEQVAIVEASRTHALLDIVLRRAQAANFVDLTNSATVQGIDLVVTTGAISQTRANQVLSSTFEG